MRQGLRVDCGSRVRALSLARSRADCSRRTLSPSELLIKSVWEMSCTHHLNPLPCRCGGRAGFELRASPAFHPNGIGYLNHNCIPGTPCCSPPRGAFIIHSFIIIFTVLCVSTLLGGFGRCCSVCLHVPVRHSFISSAESSRLLLPFDNKVHCPPALTLTRERPKERKQIEKGEKQLLNYSKLYTLILGRLPIHHRGFG